MPTGRAAAAARSPTIADRNTISVTDATVSRRLFRIAVTMSSLRAPITAWMLATSVDQLAGQLKSSRAASALALRGRDEDEQERHDEHDRDDQQGDDVEPPRPGLAERAHSSISWRLKNRIIGNTSSVTPMNRITLPAVARP